MKPSIAIRAEMSVTWHSVLSNHRTTMLPGRYTYEFDFDFDMASNITQTNRAGVNLLYSILDSRADEAILLTRKKSTLSA